jgi:tetratricopeptide (TPR) repeat protein
MRLTWPLSFTILFNAALGENGVATPNRFDDRRMRDESLRAFVKAIHTDRMVAITGAMSTERLGYPTWREFVIAYALIADSLANEILDKRGRDRRENDGWQISSNTLLENISERARRLINDMTAKGDAGGILADQRVSMWTLHELFRAVDREMRHTRAGLVIQNRYQGLALEEFERRVGAIFVSRMRSKAMRSKAAAIRPLIESLGIKRFATLNYDLELERALMLRADERELVTTAEKTRGEEIDSRVEKAVLDPGIENLFVCQDPSKVKSQSELDEIKRRACLFAAKHKSFKQAPLWPAKKQEYGQLDSVRDFIGSPRSGKPILRSDRGKLSRTMGDGVHVESDMADRERPDHLFEFAIGSTEISKHIFHLHGRADMPATMVANIRQYDRLYRLDDLYRDPFDHGLRMLIGGNPVLFVGIGMSEFEINDYLQYFVSNTPIRRPAPIFVLWNRQEHQKSDDDWRRFKIARRLDFRVRLGAYLIFEDDFVAPNIPAALDSPELTRASADPRDSLPKLIAALPALVDRVDRRISRCPDRWRSIAQRLVQASRNNQPSRLWGSFLLAESVDSSGFSLPASCGAQKKVSKLIFAASKNGFGRGALSEYILQRQVCNFPIGDSCIANSDKVDRLLVNAGFSYDSDAMLSGIARFLAMRADDKPEDYLECREKRIADGSLLRMSRQTLVIINGADRFFGSEGAPLSAEFDHFLRCVHAKSANLQVLLLCTSRMRRYCEMMGYRLESLTGLRAESSPSGPREGEVAGANLNSSYLEWVRGRFAEAAQMRLGNDPERRNTRNAADYHISAAAEAMLRRTEAIDREAQKRTFFEAFLSPPLLRALGLNCPATFEVLRTLSFIGAPVEGAVLLYAPKVRAMLAERSESEDETKDWLDGSRTDAHDNKTIRRKLSELLTRLCDLGLLIKVTPHDPLAERPGGLQEESEIALTDRYGMHRSLASFVRDRHGAPINDAKLATTFNMSMFMSEPSDSITPEPTFHDELGDLVDTLVGAWHDIARYRGFSNAELSSGVYRGESRVDSDLGKRLVSEFAEIERKTDLAVEDLYVADEDGPRAIENLPLHIHRDAAACLRAGLAVVRGYYSTGALLRFDRSDRIASTDRDGALTEHAQRLDRLISVFGDIATARSITQRVFSGNLSKLNKEDPQRSEREGVFEALIGPEPFYADDLVWLLNERATVALAKGHLFSARDALSEAARVNSAHVEKSYHGHNWRRIAISQVSVRIERGSLIPAERLLDEIEVAVNTAPWCKAMTEQAQPGDSRVCRIRRVVEHEEFGPLVGTREFTREEMFIVAMTTGYRGLIAHLRGRYHEADAYYASAVLMLRRLGEQRAYAHFQRHRATLEAFFGDKAKALSEIEHAISAAQAARQMDILHRSRVVRADLIRDTSQDQAKRRHALGEIKEALRYAALADCYRVRIEASASMARHMRIDGDYDTALRYGVDAMTIAARYGHSLQKTSLRIELGRILEARGDPVSGRALLEMAVSIGTSKGYFHALERVRRILKPSSPAVNWAHFKTSG